MGTCVICGKEFKKKRIKQCVCSEECRTEYCRRKARESSQRRKKGKIIKNKKPSLCWDCKRSVNDGCSWSKSFEPVAGWEAIPTKVITAKGSYQESYHVDNCPLFERG